MTTNVTIVSCTIMQGNDPGSAITCSCKMEPTFYLESFVYIKTRNAMLTLGASTDLLLHHLQTFEFNPEVEFSGRTKCPYPLFWKQIYILKKRFPAILQS